MSKVPSVQQYEEITERVEAGESLASVCRELGLSYGIVYHQLGRRGVKLTNSRIPGPGTFGILAELINTDRPMAHIAEERGVSHQWVQQIYKKAKDHGIPVRPRPHGGLHPTKLVESVG